MEATEGIIKEMVKTFADELREVEADEDEIVGKTDEHLPPLQKIVSTIFQRWGKCSQERTDVH